MGTCKNAGKGQFTRPYSDRIRQNGFKQKECRIRLGNRKKFVTMRVVTTVTGCPEYPWVPHP